MRAIRTFEFPFFRALALALPLLFASPAFAVTDRRAVTGASEEVGPSIPEPSSIFLFAIGVGVVGYGIHRRRRSH